MEKIMQLTYNADTDRIELDGYGLHCGDGLEVLVIKNGQPEWVRTRIEYGDEWYLIGLPGIQVNGLFAKCEA